MAYDEPELESLVPAGSEEGAQAGNVSVAALEDVATLRPRTVAEILDAAADVLRLRFFACVGIAILVWIPGRLVHFMLLDDMLDQSSDFGPLMLIMVLSQILSEFQSILAIALVAVVTAATLSGKWVSGWAALLSSLKRIPILLAAAIMAGFLKIASLIPCLVPILFVAYRLLFTQIVAVVEPVGPVDAIKRSWNLTRGGFMVFLRWCVIGAVGWVGASWISMIAGAFDFPGAMDYFSQKLGHPPAIVSRTIAFLISTLFFAFGTAVWSCIVTTYYVDCRMRRDGLDLTAWLERIESKHPVVAASNRGLV